jgi:hypothetical protein
MTSVADVGEQLKGILEAGANDLAKQAGCIQRVRKFTGADLVQTLVFGWQQHPDASLEMLASTAEVREVSVSDTAVDKRFTPQCAAFLHAVLEQMSTVVVQAAHDVPIKLLRRFSAVILEDSLGISLPNELTELWQGCGGNQDHTAAAVKLHVRWELKRGQLWGPTLTNGRTSDHRSPFNEEAVPAGSLLVQDLGYFDLQRLAERHRAGAYSLTRLHAGTALFTPSGQSLCLEQVLPPRVGQMKELHVLVGAKQRLPMRLLLLRVPKEVGDQRREDEARAMPSAVSRPSRSRRCGWRTGRF